MAAKPKKDTPSPQGKDAKRVAVEQKVDAGAEVKESVGEVIEAAVDEVVQVAESIVEEIYPLRIRLTNNTPCELFIPDARVHLRPNYHEHNSGYFVFKDKDQRLRFEADVAQLARLNNWKDAILFGEIEAEIEAEINAEGAPAAGQITMELVRV